MAHQMPTNGVDKAVQSAHTLTIDRRRHASVSGVTDVCSFHETEIILKIDTGVMIIGGHDLHVAKLLLEEGRLDIDGHIDSLMYESPKAQTRFLRKWFQK